MKLRIAYLVNGKNQYKYSGVTSGVNPQTVYTIDANTILGQVNEIFGSDNGYYNSNEEVSGIIGNECGTLKYVQGQNYYELKVGPGCGDMTDYTVYTKLVKAEKTSEAIILTEKSYVLYNNKNVTKDLTNNSSVIATGVTTSSDEYFDKGATVTYTFKLNGNSTYYFDNSKITY